MKRTLISIAVLAVSQAAFADYSDAYLSGPSTVSPFDRAYEAGLAQDMGQPVDYRQTKPVPAAVIDLSMDEATFVVEETETERRYKATLAELEENRKALDLARQEAELKLQNAHASATEAAEARLQALIQQQESIEQQKADIEKQRAAIRAQEERVAQALEMNEIARQEAERMKTEQLIDIAKVQVESEQILMMAEDSAVAIETAARTRVTLERIDPVVVMSEPVAAEYNAATLQEIVSGIMPVGWRVKTDFSEKPELETRRYQFVSTDPRDLALRRLTNSVRDAKVRFSYFWDLTDDQGNPSPMILITDRKFN